MVSRKLVTGLLHFVNQTLIDQFSKLQSTAETATHRSEFVVARIGTEKIIDLHNTFRCLRVLVETATIMFGDNESVVNSTSVPYSKLHKRHRALSYHKTIRDAIAARIFTVDSTTSEDIATPPTLSVNIGTTPV